MTMNRREPASGMFAESGRVSPCTARDIRYVRKGEAVHALVLGWPEDGVVRLGQLGTGTPIGRDGVSRVTLPGDSTPLKFRRTAQALEGDVPTARRDAIGIALVIEGNGLADRSTGDLA